jgi:murein L,D-transpeptidase YcbB/YkuD
MERRQSNQNLVSKLLRIGEIFIPNSNAIYLHDTPSKYLLVEKKRAFSGCIRVAKPAELANKIMEDDTDWNPEKIDEAMHAGKKNNTPQKFRFI